MRPVPARPLLLGLLAALAFAARPASAQDDPRLVEALHIAQEGASDSARAIVTNLLRVTPPTDSLYAQMLYTMGLVSRSVDEMRRNYTRVAVEYANSAWADDALFRLALLDYAAGNYAGVSRQLDRIRNDYPDSPTLPAASEWAARSLFDQKRPQDACAWLALGIERAGPDVELKNRLDYLNGRCTGAPPVGPPGPDTATQPAPAPGPTPAPAQESPQRTGFAVQVAAVNTQAAADKLSADLKSAGFVPYVVREAGLFKVRAGPYPDRPKALAAAEQIRKKLGHSSPFLVKEP
jgi:tetratricopeptide (TPR) repeat protein